MIHTIFFRIPAFRSAAAVAKAHGVHGLAQPLRGDLGHRKGGGAGQIEAGAENGMKPSRNGQVIFYNYI